MAERDVRAIFARTREVFATGLSVSRRLAELIRRAAGAASAPGDSVGSIAAVAIGLDESAMVILASADGERFRIVERLARDAKEAQTLYTESVEPTLDLDAVRVRYGPEIAVLRLI